MSDGEFCLHIASQIHTGDQDFLNLFKQGSLGIMELLFLKAEELRENLFDVLCSADLLWKNRCRLGQQSSFATVEKEKNFSKSVRPALYLSKKRKKKSSTISVNAEISAI